MIVQKRTYVYCTADICHSSRYVPPALSRPTSFGSCVLYLFAAAILDALVS